MERAVQGGWVAIEWGDLWEEDVSRNEISGGGGAPELIWAGKGG